MSEPTVADLDARVRVLESDRKNTDQRLAELREAIGKIEARLWILVTSGAAAGAAAGAGAASVLGG